MPAYLRTLLRSNLLATYSVAPSFSVWKSPVKFSCVIRTLLILTVCTTSISSVVGQDAPKGFTALFNGQDLEGWHGIPQHDPVKLKQEMEADPAAYEAKYEKWQESVADHWRAENNAIINDGNGVYLTTKKEYGDIELRLDYRTVALADSGIYLRGTPQVQIWDSTEEAKFNIGADKGSGGLYNNSPGAAGKDPLVLADKPFGEWNSFRIMQVGARTTVWLNDQLVVDNAAMENFWNRALPLYARGVIQLQTHGGEIQWRNLYIREIGSEEANAWLREKDEQTGYTSLFDGSTLEGWQGAVDSYDVVDGAIQCKKGAGGTLYTQDEYSDFAVRFEFQLPDGGNNGLAIRHPGDGDPAYVAMCELQVLDNTADKYAKLDERQYHGSAYGMTASHRGYLRPIGEWNYQKVVVKGSTIQVELNGTQILNTDLSEVTEFMSDREHPGKDRMQGFFGFAGHSDPVRFRSVEIAKLP